MKITRRGFIKKGCGTVVSVSALPAVMSQVSLLLGEEHGSAMAAGNEVGAYFKTAFGIDNDILRRTLAKAMSRGGDFAEIYLQHRVNDFMQFEDGAVNNTNIRVDLGAGIRVLKGDQTGYAYTEDLSEKALLRAAETAAAIAEAKRKPLLIISTR
jgi:TldD protein